MSQDSMTEFIITQKLTTFTETNEPQLYYTDGSEVIKSDGNILLSNLMKDSTFRLMYTEFCTPKGRCDKTKYNPIFICVNVTTGMNVILVPAPSGDFIIALQRSLTESVIREFHYNFSSRTIAYKKDPFVSIT